MAKFKSCYNPATRHYIANAERYTAAQAAQLATEAGYPLDIQEVADIGKGFAAYRFNGLSPTGYAEVNEGAAGSFPVWVIPVFFE